MKWLYSIGRVVKNKTSRIAELALWHNMFEATITMKNTCNTPHKIEVRGISPNHRFVVYMDGNQIFKKLKDTSYEVGK